MPDPTLLAAAQRVVDIGSGALGGLAVGWTLHAWTLTAADLLGGDEGNVPEWVKE